MKIAIIQISDIHLRGESTDVKTRLLKVPRAVAATQPDANAVLVAVSGDVANTGSESEYKVAFQYFKMLIEGLKQEFVGADVQLVCVPGNHDCDFSETQGARNGLIGHLRSSDEPEVDNSVIDLCCKPQKNYFSFANSVETLTPTRHGSLYSTYSFAVGEFNIALSCFNTAWLSQIHEQKGTLYYHVAAADSAKALTADYVISMFHHPYGWLPSNNHKRLAELVEETSDLVLTGHEHEGERFSKSTPEGNFNLYLEGDFFSFKAAPSQCAFNVVYVDFATQRQRIFSFHWAESVFLATPHSKEWTPYTRGMRTGRDFELKESQFAFLEDPGATFIHPTKTGIRLSDVFVPPNFREQKVSGKTGNPARAHMRGAEMLNKLLTTANKSLIYGKQESGKTTVAKFLYVKAYHAKLVPVLIRGDDISTNPDADRIDSLVEKALSEQYKNVPSPALPTIDKDKIFVIIDDFDHARLNARGRLKLLGDLDKRYTRICILGDDLLKLQEITEASNASSSINSYQHFDILEFGHKLRNELIEQWYSIGVEYSSNPQEVEQKVTHAETMIDGLLGKSFLPSYPIFILIFLQGIESATSQSTSAAGTYGSLYEVLITQELAGCKSKAFNIDTRRTYLSELAFWLFTNHKRRFSTEDWMHFHDEYRVKFRLSYDRSDFEDDFTKAGLIQKSDELFRFKHPYAYYYFVARYFKDNLHKDGIRSTVKGLCPQLYKEEHSSIWLFLTHLSKDPFLIESLLEHAKGVFGGIAPARFDDDIQFLKDIGDVVPKIVLKDIDVRAAKQKRLISLEKEFYKQEPRDDREPEEHEEAASDSKDDTSQVLWNELQLSFRTLQILGQVIKNFPGSLEGDDKLMLVRNAYELGLRTSERLLCELRTKSEIIIQEIVTQVRDRHPELEAKVDVESAVRRFLFWLVETMCFNTLKNVSRSVGHPHLTETYEEIAAGEESNAFKLIGVSIELDTHGVKEAALRKYASMFGDNLFCKRLLQQLYRNHVYMFPVKERIKQKICSELDIELQSSGATNMATPGGQRLPSGH